MILPDVNALVHAFDESSAMHQPWLDWLQRTVDDGEELALADHCTVGLIRIATHPRIFEHPQPASAVTAFVERLRRSPGARTVCATAATWRLFADLVDGDVGIRDNLVPDAYLAALAISHGCRLATADRGFGRFPGLRFFDPTRA
jgi:toxin-antitoxin system PIN domain toxin